MTTTCEPPQCLISAADRIGQPPWLCNIDRTHCAHASMDDRIWGSRRRPLNPREESHKITGHSKLMQVGSGRIGNVSNLYGCCILIKWAKHSVLMTLPREGDYPIGSSKCYHWTSISALSGIPYDLMCLADAPRCLDSITRRGMPAPFTCCAII